MTGDFKIACAKGTDQTVVEEVGGACGGKSLDGGKGALLAGGFKGCDGVRAVVRVSRLLDKVVTG